MEDGTVSFRIESLFCYNNLSKFVANHNYSFPNNYFTRCIFFSIKFILIHCGNIMKAIILY